MAIVCKICIMTGGLSGSEIDSLPQTEEELADHLELVHHMVVQRPGETLEDADRRVLAKGTTCPNCRQTSMARLAAHN